MKDWVAEMCRERASETQISHPFRAQGNLMKPITIISPIPQMGKLRLPKDPSKVRELNGIAQG